MKDNNTAVCDVLQKLNNYEVVYIYGKKNIETTQIANYLKWKFPNIIVTQSDEIINTRISYIMSIDIKNYGSHNNGLYTTERTYSIKMTNTNNKQIYKQSFEFMQTNKYENALVFITNNECFHIILNDDTTINYDKKCDLYDIKSLPDKKTSIVNRLHSGSKDDIMELLKYNVFNIKIISI